MKIKTILIAFTIVTVLGITLKILFAPQSDYVSYALTTACDNQPQKCMLPVGFRGWPQFP